VSPRLKIVAEGIRDAAYLSNVFDELTNKAVEAMQPVLQGIAKEFDIPYEFVGNMRSAEITASLASGKLAVGRNELARRTQDHLYWYHDGETILDTGARYREELEKEERNTTVHTPLPTNTLIGQNASVRKKIVGIVKVLSTPAEMGKLLQGEILVTSMTNPEFLPAMQRAGGFITDDGGLLCHAAIVARELKKPCIIGTKIATQVLKDGDRVEMDTEKGIVRKLS
jgi:pyruvate,water dikinase